MLRGVKIIKVVILLFVCNQSIAQVVPPSWIGIWEGKLIIQSQNSIVQELDMAIEILPKSDSSVHYTIIYYISDTITDRRAYELVVKDYEKGLYVLDELNGIVIPTRRYVNTLINMFDVMGSMLVVRSSFGDHQMQYELMITAQDKRSVSGAGSKEIPEVGSYPIFSYHNALLTKRE